MVVLIWFLLTILAINQLSRILTSVDLLEDARFWFGATFPKFQKLSICVFCQTFWFSGIASYFLVDLIKVSSPWLFNYAVVWLAVHWICEIVNEFKERYLNRAPLTVYAQVDQRTSNSEDKDSTV